MHIFKNEYTCLDVVIMDFSSTKPKYAKILFIGDSSGTEHARNSRLPGKCSSLFLFFGETIKSSYGSS